MKSNLIIDHSSEPDFKNKIQETIDYEQSSPYVKKFFRLSINSLIFYFLIDFQCQKE